MVGFVANLSRFVHEKKKKKKKAKDGMNNDKTTYHGLQSKKINQFRKSVGLNKDKKKKCAK